MDVIEKQLEYLNDIMKGTASTANSFLLKYHFGGLIAVIALLNVDLVAMEQLSIESIKSLNNPELFGLAVLLVFVLSYIYFYVVLKHYGKFLSSHRKLKYKYELTLHLLLCMGENRDYQYFMERKIDNNPVSDDEDKDVLMPNHGNDYDFITVAEYLLNHHRIKYKKDRDVDSDYLWMAMTVIVLTMLIKAVFIVIAK